MMVVHWKRATQMHPRVKLLKNQGRRRSTTTGRQMKQQALMINFKSPLLQALSWTTPLCSFWRQKRGKVRSVLSVSTNQSQLFCPHHMGHLTQMCFRLKILQEVQAKKKNRRILIARSINDHGVFNSVFNQRSFGIFEVVIYVRNGIDFLPWICYHSPSPRSITESSSHHFQMCSSRNLYGCLDLLHLH